MASKKSSKSAPRAKKTPKPAVNKSEFIRSNADKSPGDIVKLAKSRGFDLSIAMVYTILSEYRKKKGISSKKGPKATGGSVGNGRTAAKTSPKASGSLEQTFVAAIIELGATRAEELFKATLARVRAIGGK